MKNCNDTIGKEVPRGLGKSSEERLLVAIFIRFK
jgi:hypothetical protein